MYIFLVFLMFYLLNIGRTRAKWKYLKYKEKYMIKCLVETAALIQTYFYMLAYLFLRISIFFCRYDLLVLYLKLEEINIWA